MRIPMIAGNWKMNNTIAESITLAQGIYYGLRQPGEVDVVVAPPFTAIRSVADVLKDSYISVAAQNIFWEDNGAYTGEESGPLLKDAGADYVIIGHSERRQHFGEIDETVNKRIKAALKCGLIPIVCVGETLEERKADHVTQVIERQIEKGLADITAAEVSDLIMAYEPVWAIGTGKVAATPDQIEAVHIMIRGSLSQGFGSNAISSLRILYGGSLKPENSREILGLPNVDGGLIGNASLKAQSFIDIIKNAKVKV